MGEGEPVCSAWTNSSVLVCNRGGRRCSLSPRERAGVRGKGARENQVVRSASKGVHSQTQSSSEILFIMPPEAAKNPMPTTPRILIVDDDPGQRSLLNSFLTSQGFKTTVVDSGERALGVLRSEEKMNMMISDVRMPGMSGLETLRHARKEHAHLPILLVTAYTDVRDAVDAIRDGAVDYLAKPIDLDQLLSAVRNATGLSQQAPLKLEENRQLPPNIVARSPLM